MCSQERLKALLNEAKDQVDRMDAWMKEQEPAPGDSYEEWIRKPSRQAESKDSPHRMRLD